MFHVFDVGIWGLYQKDKTHFPRFLHAEITSLNDFTFFCTYVRQGDSRRRLVFCSTSVIQKSYEDRTEERAGSGQQYAAAMSLSSLRTFLLIPLLLLSLSSTALSGNVVTHLPGFSGPLPFHLETGYVTVESWEMFYSFVESEGNPSEDPVLLWLTGGPGCSGLNALTYEIGPLRFVTDASNWRIPPLEYDPTNSWTKVANIIFLDWPIGGGFTFSNQPEADHLLDDKIASIKIHKFLKKWYDDHQQFLSNPLYIAGDSYGGKMTAIVAQTIADDGNDHRPLLNLKGYLIGNPITGEALDYDTRVVFAHRVGIISDELYKEIEQACVGENYYYNEKLQCIMAMNKYRAVAQEINENSILEPKCKLSSRKRLAEISLLPPDVLNLECKADARLLIMNWTNSDAVMEALHVKKGTIEYWIGCSAPVFFAFKRTMIPSSIKYHLNLTSRGYRALVYSGDKDITVPFVGTLAWIKSLNFSITEEWRSWHVDGQVAGYTEAYANNLTFATIKNAGHTAPEYQPQTCFAMFKRWISHKPL